MPKCIDSLLEQDIPASDYEIILVDDCSPDESLAMANECLAWSLGKQSSIFNLQPSRSSIRPSIKVLHHEQNIGLAGARNTGVDAAEGEYMCFVDPDDYIEKNSLAALIKQMEDEQLDILRFNYQKVDEDYNPIPDSLSEASFDYSPQIMTGCNFLANRLGTACYVWAYIYRRTLITDNQVRFIQGGYFDDTPWLPRILQVAQRVNCVPIRHQYYMQRTNSLVHTLSHDAILRKVNGQVRLISVLQEQMLHAPQLVHRWYRKMISHSALSAMNSCAAVDIREAKNVVKELKDMKIFPLTTFTNKLSTRIHLLIANISPFIYCRLIHLYLHKS